MPITERLYTAALRTAYPLLPVLARGKGKLARGVRGRTGVLERLQQWANAERDPGRPLVWFHAPSVGEGLQARAVMEVLRRERPDAQIAYTYFSPSAEGFARTLPADVADYLPLDLPAHAARALDALRPAVIAFTKTEVWPNLAAAAVTRGVRLALLSATLPSSSSRLSGLARPLLRPAYRRLHRLAAISPVDAERYGALGVPPERRSVMGDARFDQVWKRASTADRSSPLLRPLLADDRPVLVAGSTWAPDETRLIAAVRQLRHDGPSLRLVLVPHEPTPEHLAATEELIAGTDLSSRRLSTIGEEAGALPDAIVVDRIGVLGDLYAAADLAYVGGGFGTAGLHSVLEPAAYGVPVIFGPRHGNAREAGELIRTGGGFAVADESALRDQLWQLLHREEDLRAAGAAARAYVAAGLGAAERGAQIISELLG